MKQIRYFVIQNALRWLSPNGTIVMHDCNPRKEPNQVVPKLDEIDEWNGDTWKAAVAMRLRSDVEIVVVDVDHGVGVIRKRTNRHQLPKYWQDYLNFGAISMLTYEDLEDNRETLLRLISMKELREWFDEELIEKS